MPSKVNKPLSQFNFAQRQNEVQQSALKPKSAFGNYKMAEAQNQAKVQKAPENPVAVIQPNPAEACSGEEPSNKQQAENALNMVQLS